MKPFIKDPDATLDYEWDWAQWLGDDVILEHSVAAQAGLTMDHSTATDTAVTAWLKGGTEGIQYGVSCRITTANGRIDDRTIMVLVRSK